MSENNPFVRDNLIIGDLKKPHITVVFFWHFGFERSEIINILLKSIPIKIVC